MDPNQTQPTPSPVQPATNAVPQPVVADPDPPQSSHTMLYVILAGVVVLGGLFYYLYSVMNSQSGSTSPSSYQKPTVQKLPAVTTAPTAAVPTPGSVTEQEIQSLDTGDPTSDISDIKKDASGL